MTIFFPGSLDAVRRHAFGLAAVWMSGLVFCLPQVAAQGQVFKDPAAAVVRIIPVGHAGVDIVQATRRYGSRVAAIGEPNAAGEIYRFAIDISDLAVNEVRSWRITFVSGALFAYVFQVRSNDGAWIEVTSLDGPLNGIAVGDGLLIEDMQTRRPTPQMRPGA